MEQHANSPFLLHLSCSQPAAQTQPHCRHISRLCAPWKSQTSADLPPVGSAFVLYADACGGTCSLSRNLCSHIIFPVSLPLQICSPHPCPMFVPMLCIFTTEFHLSLLQMDAFLLKSKFYEVRILGPLPWCITTPKTDSGGQEAVFGSGHYLWISSLKWEENKTEFCGICQFLWCVQS